jgi:hypothetical protein
MAVCACLALTSAANASASLRMSQIVTRVRLHRDHLLRELRDGTRHARARAAIVGGGPIAITQAPWQVVVIAFISEDEALICGGSILNETEVLTAGHCVYNPYTQRRIPADDIIVGAGTSDYEIEPEQVSLASSVRVHPYFDYNPEATHAIPDDVAVLELERSLVYNAAVHAIGPVSAGTLLPEGTAVNLTGFGQEIPDVRSDGELHSLGMTLDYSRECGGEANALFLCASAPTGSACYGDSGGALTLSGSPVTIAGVADTTEVIDGEPCTDGSIGGFVNVAAPEISDFIWGDSPDPPQAPRGGGAEVSGVPEIGYALSCEPGFWSYSPTYPYKFIDSADGQVLQQGPADRYTLTGADLGRTILCEVLAANEGGTGVGRTPALSAIRHTPQEEAAEAEAKKRQEEAAAPKVHEEQEMTAAKKRQEEAAAKGGVLGIKEGAPAATLASTSLQVGASGTVKIKVSCPAGVSSCAGTFTLRTLGAVSASVVSTARAKPSVLTLATGSFTVPGGQVRTLTLHLSFKALALLERSHVLRVRVTIAAHDPAGGTHTGQAIATLRLSKTKHGKG